LNGAFLIFRPSLSPGITGSSDSLGRKYAFQTATPHLLSALEEFRSRNEAFLSITEQIRTPNSAYGARVLHRDRAHHGAIRAKRIQMKKVEEEAKVAAQMRRRLPLIDPS
jgi:hypothetical protein